MNIGNKILTARKKLNMSQKDLALKLDVSTAVICDYEKDRKYPKIQNLKKLIEVLQLDSQKFLDINVKMIDLTADELVLNRIKENKEIYNLILNNYEEFKRRVK